MKRFIITVLRFYKNIISPFIHQLLGIQSACRFEVSCSEYAMHNINKHGVIKGGMAALLRLSKCQPFYNIKKEDVAY